LILNEKEFTYILVFGIWIIYLYVYKEEDMRKTTSTENQLVIENDRLSQAVCTFTAWYECMAEEFAEKKSYRSAINAYRDLIRVHNQNPLRSSADWVAQYEVRLVYLYKMLEQAQPERTPVKFIREDEGAF